MKLSLRVASSLRNERFGKQRWRAPFPPMDRNQTENRGRKNRRPRRLYYVTNTGDPQLEAAISHMLEELTTNGFKAPARPAYPDRKGFGIRSEDK